MPRKTGSTTPPKAAGGTELIEILHARFVENMHRHNGISWKEVERRLLKKPAVVETLSRMEATGGEPDVVRLDNESISITFCDCSPESPKDRRSLCYDGEALNSRKEHRPRTSALEMAAGLGVTILNEDQYRALQQLGEFDIKSSSWLLTPPAVRKLGGALFGDRRFNRTFVYHNGAESYFGARGFRGSVTLE